MRKRFEQIDPTRHEPIKVDQVHIPNDEETLRIGSPEETREALERKIAKNNTRTLRGGIK